MRFVFLLLGLVGCGQGLSGIKEGAACGDKHGFWCESFTGPSTLFECKDGTWQAYLYCQKCELVSGNTRINCELPSPVRLQEPVSPLR